MWILCLIMYDPIREEYQVNAESCTQMNQDV